MGGACVGRDGSLGVSVSLALDDGVGTALHDRCCRRTSSSWTKKLWAYTRRTRCQCDALGDGVGHALGEDVDDGGSPVADGLVEPRSGRLTLSRCRPMHCVSRAPYRQVAPPRLTPTASPPLRPARPCVVPPRLVGGSGTSLEGSRERGASELCRLAMNTNKVGGVQSSELVQASPDVLDPVECNRDAIHSIAIIPVATSVPRSNAKDPSVSSC